MKRAGIGMIWGVILLAGIGIILGAILPTGVANYSNKPKKDVAVVNHNLRTINKYKNFKKVALTFDDGPSGKYTERLLDILKEQNVKATFFIIGESIKGNENILQRMKGEGHLIGNHTYHHSRLTKLKYAQAVEEINDTNALITSITGETPQYIRPPFGSFTEKILDETSMSVVMWNVDPQDWKYQNKDIVTDRILKNVKDGDIILMHDIFESSVDAAEMVIRELKKRDYVFVTVEQLNANEKIIRH